MWGGSRLEDPGLQFPYLQVSAPLGVGGPTPEAGELLL